jgi:hypothetical protein
MKKCLSPEDFRELSETQKSALRNLWLPCKYDVAFEIVWRDVENDIYDAAIIVILDARVMNTPRNCEVVLKVYYPGGIPEYESRSEEYLESPTEEDDDHGWGNETANNDDYEAQPENGEIENQTGMVEGIEKSEEHYLVKENCLPLLNIGQMIDILREHKGVPNISFTPEEAICYVCGTEFSGEELCDALWEAVKTIL